MSCAHLPGVVLLSAWAHIDVLGPLLLGAATPPGRHCVPSSLSLSTGRKTTWDTQGPLSSDMDTTILNYGGPVLLLQPSSVSTAGLAHTALCPPSFFNGRASWIDIDSPDTAWVHNNYLCEKIRGGEGRNGDTGFGVARRRPGTGRQRSCPSWMSPW